jgi:hypothetical protein
MNYHTIWFVSQPHEVWLLHHHSITAFCLLVNNPISASDSDIPWELKQGVAEELENREVRKINFLHNELTHPYLEWFEELSTELPIKLALLPTDTDILKANLLSTKSKAMTGDMNFEELIWGGEYLTKQPEETAPSPPKLSDFKQHLWRDAVEQYKRGGGDIEALKSFGIKLGLSLKVVKEKIKKEVEL